ncbi:hypothetical protein BH10ACT8_BH10ACT8_13370 [soil metagenome]
MSDQVTDTIELDAPAPLADSTPADVVSSDVLVEEVSIDGMCGVY